LPDSKGHPRRMHARFMRVALLSSSVVPGKLPAMRIPLNGGNVATFSPFRAVSGRRQTANESATKRAGRGKLRRAVWLCRTARLLWDGTTTRCAVPGVRRLAAQPATVLAAMHSLNALETGRRNRLHCAFRCSLELSWGSRRRRRSSRRPSRHPCPGRRRS